MIRRFRTISTVLAHNVTSLYDHHHKGMSSQASTTDKAVAMRYPVKNPLAKSFDRVLPSWSMHNLNPIPAQWFDALEMHRAANGFDSNLWMTHAQGQFRPQGKITINGATSEAISPTATTSTRVGLALPLKDAVRAHDVIFFYDLPHALQENIWQHHPLSVGQLSLHKAWTLDLTSISFEELERRYSDPTTTDSNHSIPCPSSATQEAGTDPSSPILASISNLTHSKDSTVGTQDGIRWRPATTEELNEALTYYSANFIPNELLLVKSKEMADRNASYGLLTVYNAQETSDPFSLDGSLCHRHLISGDRISERFVGALTSAYSVRQFRSLKWLPAEAIETTTWRPAPGETPVRAHEHTSDLILHISQLPSSLQQRLRSRLPAHFLGKQLAPILRWGFNDFRYERTIVPQLEKLFKANGNGLPLPQYLETEVPESIWFFVKHLRDVFPDATMDQIGHPVPFDFGHTKTTEFFNMEQLSLKQSK